MVLVIVMFVFRFFVKNTESQPPHPLGFKPRCGAGCFHVSGGPGALAPHPSGQVGHQAQLAAGQPGSPQGRPSGASLFSSTSPPLESRVSGLEGGPAISLLVCVCDWSGVYFFSSAWSDDSCALTSSQQHPEPQVHDTWFHFLPRRAAWRWW